MQPIKKIRNAIQTADTTDVRPVFDGLMHRLRHSSLYGMRMHGIAVIISLALLGLAACNNHSVSQDNLPDLVNIAFKERFPDMHHVHWERINPEMYEAHFTSGSDDMLAEFNAGGEWIETQRTIEKSELPQSVALVLEYEFGAYQAEDFRYADTAAYGDVYQVILKKDGETIKLRVKENGEVLSKEAVK